MSDWFELPSGGTRGFEYERRIREWRPGDGLTCSAAAANRRQPCGPPAAVIETVTVDERDWRRPERSKPRQRLVCTRHVAETVRKAVGDAERHGAGFIVDAEKAARESVLAAHWDEFQEKFSAEMERLEAHYLGLLPESLRPLMGQEKAA